jgi:chromosome segregation ATPase
VRDARQQAAAAADLEKSLAQTTDAAAKAKAAAALQSEEVRNVRAQLEKALTDLEVARRDKEALEELRRNSINEEVARNQASQKRLDELATEKRELLAQLRAAQQSEANAKGALGKAQIELDLAGKTAEETRQKVADLEARVEAEVGKRAASESTQSELLSKAKRLESENEMQQSQLEEKDRKIETLEVQVQARNATKEMANVRKSATRPGSGNGRK